MLSERAPSDGVPNFSKKTRGSWLGGGAYAVMSFGGFLGLGHSHYPIPWAALKYDTALEGYRTGITESQLKDAPEFSDDSWGDREWETKTHQHYGAPGYWGA